MDLSLLAAGLVVGTIVGLTGVGGGSLMTPFLIMYGVSPAIAVGTDLVFAAITKSGGMLAHHRAGAVQWRIVGLLALGSVPAAVISILVLESMQDAGYDYDAIITRCLSIALLASGVVLLFRDRVARATWHPRYAGLHRFRDKHATLLTPLAGFALGVLVSLSSVGAGALGAAMLLGLYPGLSAVRIIGTDIAHAVPLAAIAGFGHWRLGSVNFLVLAALLVGSLPGILLGARLAVRFPDRWLQGLLGTMLLVLGIGFLVRG
jgi:hypothetical protein